MIWPWSTIAKLRAALDDEVRSSINERSNLRRELTRSVEDGAELAKVVMDQAREIDDLRAVVSTLRKTGVIVNVQEGKR